MKFTKRCSISQVSWSHNEVTLQTDGRHEIGITQRDTEFTTMLDIHKVEPQDAGSYKLTARNDLGELTASVSLIVNGEKQHPMAVCNASSRQGLNIEAVILLVVI